MLTFSHYKLFFLLMIALTLAGCDSSYTQSENSKQPITSCNATEMNKINVSTLDIMQKSAICNIMVATIHRLPPVYLLKDFERFVSLIKSTASDDTVNSIATQAMLVVKSRHQQNNDEGMQNTFATLWRIYQNTQTHVTLRDVNMGLKNSSIIASSLSDESLEQFGVSLWRTRNMSQNSIN